MVKIGLIVLMSTFLLFTGNGYCSTLNSDNSKKSEQIGSNCTTESGGYQGEVHVRNDFGAPGPTLFSRENFKILDLNRYELTLRREIIDGKMLNKGAELIYLCPLSYGRFIFKYDDLVINDSGVVAGFFLFDAEKIGAGYREIDIEISGWGARDPFLQFGWYPDIGGVSYNQEKYTSKKSITNTGIFVIDWNEGEIVYTSCVNGKVYETWHSTDNVKNSVPRGSMRVHVNLWSYSAVNISNDVRGRFKFNFFYFPHNSMSTKSSTSEVCFVFQ